jgi:hypothetical protein
MLLSKKAGQAASLFACLNQPLCRLHTSGNGLTWSHRDGSNIAGGTAMSDPTNLLVTQTTMFPGPNEMKAIVYHKYGSPDVLELIVITV